MPSASKRIPSTKPSATKLPPLRDECVVRRAGRDRDRRGLRDAHDDFLVATGGFGDERATNGQHVIRHVRNIERAVVDAAGREAGDGDFVTDLEAVVIEPSQHARVQRARLRPGKGAGTRHGSWLGRQRALIPLHLDDRSRVVGEGPQESLINEPDRRVVGDRRRGVVAVIVVAGTWSVRNKRAIGPIAVEVGQRVGDVTLSHEVAQHVAQVTLVAGNRLRRGAEARRYAFRKTVDQGVRPMISRRMRQEAVAPGQDLRLPLRILRRVERRVALRLPGHIEHAREPGGMVDWMDRELAHQHIGKSVASHRTAIVKSAVIDQRVPDRIMHLVRHAVDGDEAIVHGIVGGLVGQGDVNLRIERHAGQGAAAEFMFVGHAHQVPRFVQHDLRHLPAVSFSRQPRQGNVFGEDESTVAEVVVARIDLLGESVVMPPLRERPAIAADVHGGELASCRTLRGKVDVRMRGRTVQGLDH